MAGPLAKTRRYGHVSPHGQETIAVSFIRDRAVCMF